MTDEEFKERWMNMGDKPAVLHITTNASEAARAVRVPKEGHICTVKEGSQIALWSPHGFPEALIIAHPDDAPRLVYFDGTEEELTVKDGSIFLPPIVISEPGQDATFEAGIFDRVTEWTERLVEVDRETFDKLDRSLTGIPVYSCTIDGKREVWPTPDDTAIVEWSEQQDPEKW